ncbi:MAG TPA: HIT family protein [Patescibacteria group bacterium]|nr:HIT family protein [Patescibacteria group bacterium]
MCLFCNQEFFEKQGVLELITAYAVDDSYAVTKGHKLIIPFVHKKTYWDLSREELDDIYSICTILKEEMVREDPTITGFNVGWNCGESAGQTIMHAHCHLIPRRDGDVEDPIGGVRNVIPGKGNYKKQL